jgi:hypothetical protein
MLFAKDYKIPLSSGNHYHLIGYCWGQKKIINGFLNLRPASDHVGKLLWFSLGAM